MIESIFEKLPDEMYIEDLVYYVSDALEKLNIFQSSKRVSILPSERTIRYYRSKGIIDPPVKYEKNRAIYAKRHFLQAVLIKSLEARGFSLKVIKKFLEKNDEQLKKYIQEIPSLLFTLENSLIPSRAIYRAPEPMVKYYRSTSSRWYRFKIDDGIELLIRDDYLPEKNKTKFLSNKFKKILESLGGE